MGKYANVVPAPRILCQGHTELTQTRLGRVRVGMNVVENLHREFTQTRSGRGKIPRKIPRVWHYTYPTEHNLANFGMAVLDGSAKKTQDWLLTDWVVFFRASVNIKKCLKIPKIRGITL